MYHPFFVCIRLKNSVFGEFSNIYLLSAQNRVKWRHKIRPIAKNFRPILIFFAQDDAKLMPGEVCQVSCRYSNKWISYSGKTEGGGSDPTPPRRWRVKMGTWNFSTFPIGTFIGNVAPNFWVSTLRRGASRTTFSGACLPSFGNFFF